MFGSIRKPIEEMSVEELRLAKDIVKAYANEHGWHATEYVQPREDFNKIEAQLKKKEE